MSVSAILNVDAMVEVARETIRDRSRVFASSCRGFCSEGEKGSQLNGNNPVFE